MHSFRGQQVSGPASAVFDGLHIFYGGSFSLKTQNRGDHFTFRCDPGGDISSSLLLINPVTTPTSLYEIDMFTYLAFLAAAVRLY